MSDVGNGRCYKSDDDEWNHKSQKLAEDAIECEKQSDPSLCENIAKDNSQYDGNENFAEKRYLYFFHVV